MAQNENVDQTSAENVDTGETFDWMSLAEQAKSTGVDLSLQQFLTNVAPADQPAAVAAIAKGLAAPTPEDKQLAQTQLEAVVGSSTVQEFQSQFLLGPTPKVANVVVNEAAAAGPNGLIPIANAMEASKFAQENNLGGVTALFVDANATASAANLTAKAKIDGDRAALLEAGAAESLKKAQDLAEARAKVDAALGEAKANWGFFDILSSEKRGNVQKLAVQKAALGNQFEDSLRAAQLANQRAQVLQAQSKTTADYAKAKVDEETIATKIKNQLLAVGIADQNMGQMLTNMEWLYSQQTAKEEKAYQRGQVSRAGKDKAAQELAQAQWAAAAADYAARGVPIGPNFGEVPLKNIWNKLSQENKDQFISMARSGIFGEQLSGAMNPDKPSIFIPTNVLSAFNKGKEEYFKTKTQQELAGMSKEQLDAEVKEYIANSNRIAANDPVQQSANALAANSAVLQELQDQWNKMSAAGKQIPKGLKDEYASAASTQRALQEMINTRSVKADESLFSPSNLKEMHTRIQANQGVSARDAANQMAYSFYKLANATAKLKGLNAEAINFMGGNATAPTLLVQRGGKNYNITNSSELFHLLNLNDEGLLGRFNQSGVGSTLESRATEMQMSAKTPYDF